MRTEVALADTRLGTETVLNRPRLCIHDQFELQVRRAPDAVAVNNGEERLSYRELNEQANQLANFLRAAGVGPEVPVALYLERSVKMVVAILGVLKAGGAYVPIDLAYPRERAAFMLEDTKAPILLTQEKLLAALPAHSARTVCLDTGREAIAAQPVTNPVNAATADNAAYIIYTSGSTGKPKGVLVTHHNVVRLLEQTEPWYQFNANDVWPLFHSYAFDVSVWELWGSLFHGGRLVIVPYLISRSPAEFYELLAREKVTVLNQTPSAFRQLIWAEATAPAPRELSLRYVICAGEALELQSLKPWFERHGDEKPRVVNMYGITETTVHSTYRVIRQADLAGGVGSVVGVPIPDLQIYLVDDDLKPVPVGTSGEICVGGAGVARGYLNRPDLTSKRFLSDPFSSDPKARMYRSGDLAQYTPAGELEYLGRMDHQVKIRGFRVELGEIESALNRHPAIRESVVVAQDETGGGKRLVAYFVPIQSAPTVTELREFLGQKVPDYMVPAFFISLDALPLTTNGKVDRRALPAPGSERPELKEQFLAPRNETEQALAAIWSEVLEIGQVGVHDNFFELGGDSIRSIAVLSRAQQRGWRLSLQDIFQHPTVAGLAVCAEAATQDTASARTEPFSLVAAEDREKLPADVEDAYPVAKLQMGMFYHNELNPASAIYHDVFSFRIQSAFDRKKLEMAVHRLAERHPLLRTSFHLGGFSEPLQLVHRAVQVPFTVEDLRGFTPEGQAERVVAWIETEKRRPFDRRVAPLVRFHAQLHDEQSFQFIISFHHCCLDGWSLAAAMTEILQDYAALLQGADHPIAAPRVTYREFVALERRTIAAEESQRFWSEKLADASLQLLPRLGAPGSLPASSEEPQVAGRQAGAPGFLEQVRGPEVHIPAPVLDGLKRIARQAGVPLKTVLLASHQYVMSVLYGQADIVSGLISNGRPEDADGEKMIGLFLNALPIRLELKGGAWLDLVRQAFAAEQQIIPHRRFPLAEIQKLLGGRPVFETAFDFVHFHVYKGLQGRLDIKDGHYFEANDTTTYTTFMLDVTSTELELHIDYNANLLSRQQIEEMTAYYVRTLEAMVADPQGRYETFSPLSEAERRKMLVEWNATEADYPRDARLHQLFEARAEETPEATALVCEQETWTYRQLNEQAELVARRLRELPIEPGALVGVYMERSPHLVAGLLGILKAGGAYVPLDPAYPKERLAVMLEDARLSALIAQRELLEGLPETTARILCLPDAPEAAASLPASSLGPPASLPASPLAYVIYTSGSTGRPKAVQVFHRAVINVLTSIARLTGMNRSDNLLAVTTLSFDIAALEIFLPLITGARLTLASREKASDGTQLATLIETAKATILQGTPATWRLLIESGWKGNQHLKAFCGGEALKRNLADELLARAGEVWNFYGPTETTIWSAAWKVRPGEPVSIGRPLANTQLYVLDSRLQPLPVGTVGELHIGGDGLARGYLNRPGLTDEKFIANPFSNQPGSRLYKTGDLARYWPDGRVECLGRIDHQVKIRGFRIEPGEVESVLRRHEGIADALVAAREDAFGEKRLVGYVISRNGPPSVLELRDFIKARLPHFMVPAQFVVLKQFPLTPNGKVDVRRLPAPEICAPIVKDFMAPRNDDERSLATIWQEVLMIPQVGVDQNFFEVGGDSLSATRAFARINRTFGTDLTLREVFEHPTIAALAVVVQKRRGTAQAKMQPIPRRPRVFTSVKTM